MVAFYLIKRLLAFVSEITLFIAVIAVCVRLKKLVYRVYVATMLTSVLWYVGCCRHWGLRGTAPVGAMWANLVRSVVLVPSLHPLH